MKKHTVLVFPCGSEIGLELYRSLGYSTHFKLIGGSSVDDHGKFVYQNYIPDLPMVNDESFIDKINDIIEKHSIDFIFPAHDSVVLKLAQAKDAGKLKCEVITSPAQTCEIARSKRKTAETFEDIIPTARIFGSVDEIGKGDYPVFLKPDVGQGSKGTYKASTPQEVVFHLQQDPTLLILEYLPGKEYTVDCFTDSKGELRFCEGRQRVRISNGISVNSVSVDDDRFKELADKINQRLVFRGMWFFQVKERSDGELVLMEIAPRVAGTMGLVRNKGVNLALLSLFDALGYDVDVFGNNFTMTIDRALHNRYKHDMNYSHAYIDFDDLVVFDGKINPYVMAFVFQCMNKGVKVHLLTRHKKDITTSLTEHRLDKIFDDIIWVQKDDDEKHRYITEKDAIFIDDSFAERKKVHDALGIPVFDAHMIEGLMEPF